MYWHTECALDGAHKHISAFLIRSINALMVLAAADGHPQVAWYREQRNRTRLFYVVHHHQRVAALAADVSLCTNGVEVCIGWVGACARI